ncbi:MAG: hypothetical protein HQK84_00460 [Nitrospinae bacterium]|nr:hypothetical protein [Nitrospinota bacterium]
MDNDLSLLIDIQECLNHVNEEIKKVKTLKEEINVLEEHKEKALGELNVVLGNEKEIADSIKKYEQDIEDCKAKIVKCRVKQNEVKTNKEYKALISEIEGHEKTIDSFEEKILELMEKTESVKEASQKAQEEFKSAEKELNDQKGDHNQQIKEAEEKIMTLSGQVEEFEKSMSPGILRIYLKLKERTHNKPLVEVIDGICQGCFHTIPPQDFIELKKLKELMTCNNCLRYIYFLTEQ